MKKLEAQLDELDNSSNVRVPPRPALNNDADDSEALAARVAWVQAAALAGEKAFPDESSAENKKWTKVRTEGEELAMDQMMVEERVEEMNVGGVVMEEQELQALADLKGWDIEIRSLICIKTSSDFGSLLKRITTVKPLAQADAGDRTCSGKCALSGPRTSNPVAKKADSESDQWSNRALNFGCGIMGGMGADLGVALLVGFLISLAADLIIFS